MQITKKQFTKIINSKKDFLFFDSKNQVMTNYVLTNDFKLKKQFTSFRVVSTIQSKFELTTI